LEIEKKRKRKVLEIEKKRKEGGKERERRKRISEGGEARGGKGE